MKRCKNCAVALAMSFDTDYIPVAEREVVEEIEIIMSDDTTKRMSSPQRIAVEEWNAFQKDLRWKALIRKACAVGVIAVILVCGYVAYRIGR